MAQTFESVLKSVVCRFLSVFVLVKGQLGNCIPACGAVVYPRLRWRSYRSFVSTLLISELELFLSNLKRPRSAVVSINDPSHPHITPRAER